MKSPSPLPSPNIEAHSRIPRTALLLVVLHQAALFAHADVESDWANWRGPLVSGESPAGQPASEWSETKNVKWKVKIPGSGTATPIVLGDKIYIATAINTKRTPDGGATDGGPGAGEPEGAGDSTPPPTPPPPSGVRQTGQAPGQSGDGALQDWQKRFDANEDGKLDETEQNAMREAFRERRNRGERGGRGGRGGQGGGGGGRGSQKPTELHQFVLLCLDRQSGKQLWQTVAREEVPHEGHHNDHGFASASPVTDGEHIVVSFGSRGIYCFDMAGKKVWEKDFGDMRTRNGFGEGTSPALHGDTVIVRWDHEGDSFIVALDKLTGDERWRKVRDEATAWSTPFVVDSAGKPVVVVAGTNMVAAYDLKSGEIVWQTEGLTGNVIPSPVSDGEMVYVMSGFRGSKALAIKLGKTGKLSGSDAIAWTHEEGTPYVPSPLLYDGRLYFYQSNSAILTCLDAKTGSPHYSKERIEGIRGAYASPLGAAGKVYLLGREGNCVVIKSGDDLEVVATNTLDEKFDASPIVVGDDLLLRGHEYLYCISEEKKTGS